MATQLAVPIEIKRAPTGLVLYAEVPEVDERSLSVGLSQDGVELRGRRRLGPGAWARFRQIVGLPVPVDPEAARVNLHEGLLRVALPYA